MEKLRLVLDDWFTAKTPSLIPRNLFPEEVPEDMAVAVMGVRRAGKTYTLFEVAQKLRKRLPFYNVLYINFEDDRLLPLNGKELKDLPSALLQHFEVKKGLPLWFLLDEIQHIPGWEKSIRRFLDRRIAKVVITGSTASISPRTLSTSLAGRVFPLNVFPLSFREFLKFKKFAYADIKSLQLSLQNDVLKLFNDFLLYGGFPTVVLSSNKREILATYFDSIFYRDLVERHGIRKIAEFEAFVRLLLRNSANRMSLTKIVHTLRSMGHKISKATASEYLNFAKDAFLIWEVEIFSYKLKDRMQYPRKVYSIDTGFVHLGQFKLKMDWGVALENAVFIELKRRGEEVYFWQNERGLEVDFVIVRQMEPYMLIQVVWDFGDEKTLKREERALARAMEELGISKALIITRSTFGERSIKDARVPVMPFWYWSLSAED